jgi:chromosome segregation ATPase
VTTSKATSPLAPSIEVPGATIIPFPVLKRAAPAGAANQRPPVDERLARALANLTAAVEEQRSAVKNWQGAISELKTSTAGLRDGLVRYQASLGDLADGVSKLGSRARSLQKWAEKAEAAST